MKDFMYKVRKFMGLTLFEDAIKDITKEDIEKFNASKQDKSTDNGWVASSSFTGI